MSFSIGSAPLRIAGAIGGFLGAQAGVLQLDTILFNETALEVPESIGNLGGHQVVEQHDFPGGARSQQTFGAFPDVIEWSGYLTGTNAFQRMQQIDLIRVTGREVPLIYGPKAFMGRVEKFEPRPRHAWLVPYRIRFLPRTDQSQASTSQQAAETPEAQLNDQTTGLTDLSNNQPFSMPSSLVTPVQTLLSTVSGALAQANGIIDNIGTGIAGTILGYAGNVRALATPLFNNPNPETSYMAQASSTRSVLIGQLVQHPIVAPYRVIRVINPSLPALAAQYLGDANRWKDIAAFNVAAFGSVMDPSPIGSFLVNIPNPNTSPVAPA